MAALADAQAIAIATGRKASTVRGWAAHGTLQGKLERKGTDERGRVLFDVEEAAALARRLDAAESQAQLDNHPDQGQH